MKYEIAIKEANKLKAFDNFLKKTETDLVNAQGYKLITDDDVTHAGDVIKDLKAQETAITTAEKLVIKLTGLERFNDERDRRRDCRLELNRQVVNAKQKIKDDAVNFFVNKVGGLIEKSGASQLYKNNINAEKIALTTISGRHKDLIGLLNAQLVVLEKGLDEDAKEVIDKNKIIMGFSSELRQDIEYLLTLNIESIKPTLEVRKIEQEQKVKQLADERIAHKESVAKIKEQPTPPPTPTKVINKGGVKEDFYICLDINATLEEAKKIAESASDFFGQRFILRRGQGEKI